MRNARLRLITTWVLNMATPYPLLIGCAGPIGAAGSAEPNAWDGPASGSAAASDAIVLVPFRTELDFGIVSQGGQQRVFFELRNSSTEVVEVYRIETSCDCLEVTLAKRRLGPGEKGLACAFLDLARAPRFSGQRGVEVKGLASDGTGLFSIVMDVDVRPRSDFEGLELGLPAVAKDVEPVPMPAPMVEAERR